MANQRRIAVVTVARSDYSGLRPVLRGLRDHSLFQPFVVAGADHLVDGNGDSLSILRRDGFEPSALVPCEADVNRPAGVALAVSDGVRGFAAVFEKTEPCAIVIFGDRFEMLSAALAGFFCKIPLIHFHGGELSYGAIDDSIRHAITKLSHLHFVSSEEARNRLLRMGEEPARIVASGAPALDDINELANQDIGKIFVELGLAPESSPLLITFHPETLSELSAEEQAELVLGALEQLSSPMIFTRPNADAGSEIIWNRIQAFARTKADRRKCVENLGPQKYYAVMKASTAMIGNSSSGIIEAASFAKPVLNIGDRQAGRLRAANVVDVPFDIREMQAGIQKVCSRSFQAALKDMINPYGDGQAVQRVLRTLEKVEFGPKLLRKEFFAGV